MSKAKSRQRKLLIPYAVDADTDEHIPAAALEEQMYDLRSPLRLQATADRDTLRRHARRFECPECRQKVYPHAPLIFDGRHYWSHRRNAGPCPLEVKRALNPDEINACIFNGRQEGEAHKRLVALLSRLAEQDPDTVPGTLSIGSYESPTPEMRDEFPHGRFPDVAFTYRGDRVVLEAQLATISLYGINGRRAFYERRGNKLLWVMRNFDTRYNLRASVRDIVADQGIIFSIDGEIEALCAVDRIFRLRAWQWERGGERCGWKDKIVLLSSALALVTPIKWEEEFKQHWIAAYKGKHYIHDTTLDPLDFLNEAAHRAKMPSFERGLEADCLLSLMRLLISLEAGSVIGARHPKLISLANSFDQIGDAYRARSLVIRALERWAPSLLVEKSMVSALKRAEQVIRTGRCKEWGRQSHIGKLREVIFPDWQLAAKPTPIPMLHYATDRGFEALQW
jgi:hypothetical protein